MVKRILLGNYGDGTFGIKTSLPGYDVSVRADDFDLTKRSFNSEWQDLINIHMVGVASYTFVQFQARATFRENFAAPDFRMWRNSWSGWKASPILIPTGLTYIPIWEERYYNPSTKTFYDDYLVGSAVTTPSPAESSYSGARSWFGGPGALPNTLYFSPKYLGQATDPSSPYLIEGSFGYTGLDQVSSNLNQIGGVMNQWVPDYPPYPEYPAMPSTNDRCVYVVYKNKLGDTS